MKKHYEPPKAEVTVIENEDIIMTSGLFTEKLTDVDLGVKCLDIEIYN